MTRTRIGIIGAGNMGSAFAKRLGAAGFDVAITAKDAAHAEQAARDAGGSVRAVPRDQIAREADVIILATSTTTRRTRSVPRATSRARPSWTSPTRSHPT